TLTPKVQQTHVVPYARTYTVAYALSRSDTQKGIWHGIRQPPCLWHMPRRTRHHESRPRPHQWHMPRLLMGGICLSRWDSPCELPMGLLAHRDAACPYRQEDRGLPPRWHWHMPTATGS